MAAMVDWVLGLLDATGLELMFGISALIGGVLFMLWLILIVVLSGIGDIAEGVTWESTSMQWVRMHLKALTFFRA